MLIRIRIVLAEPRDHPAGTSLPTAPSVSTIHPHPRLTHPHPQLNVSVPEHLARLAQTHKATLVYISTDYVFDGTSPPYPPSARTHPLNLYGRTKRDGELAVLGVVGARAVVLRVPVLYGPAPRNADTAVNVLLDVVADQSGKEYKMDHFATRYPTCVVDIADFLVRLSCTYLSTYGVERI